jgi:hypothetical protein
MNFTDTILTLRDEIRQAERNEVREQQVREMGKNKKEKNEEDKVTTASKTINQLKDISSDIQQLLLQYPG